MVDRRSFNLLARDFGARTVQRSDETDAYLTRPRP
jgi:hypothetical protein